MRPFAVILIATLATPSVAGAFDLDWPVDCTLGQDCFIQQYVDHDPSEAATDFTCGSLSYDGHNGTDIALASLQAMNAGVDVRAAAAGTVRGLRDGMSDQYVTHETRAEISGRECGNGVVLLHEGGWETQYCHLKKGSIQVKRGDRIEAGTVLGQVGLSGLTEFPHLHLSLRRGEQVVDPFAPDRSVSSPESCGRTTDATLWSEPVEYVPGGLVSAGFSDKVPDYAEVKAGTADLSPLPRNAAALVAWVYAYGSQSGDMLSIRIADPEGRDILTQGQMLDRTQAQFFRAMGRRLSQPLAPGRYSAEFTLERDGKVLDRLRHIMTIEP